MRTLLVYIFCISAASSWAQPKWIDFQLRSSLYPEEKYLLGFSSQQSRSRTEEELREDAEMAARSELTERVITNIKSITLSTVENTNSITETYFKKISSSSSNLKISGLKTEHYFDEKKKIAYCIVYALRNQVVEWYEMEAEKNFELLETKVRLAQSKSSKPESLKLYLECFAFFPALEETYTVITALKRAQPFAASKIEEKRQFLLDNINALTNASPNSLADLAAVIATQYKLLLSPEVKTIVIKPLTYQNTFLASTFSAKLSIFFEQKMGEIAGVSLSNQASSGIEFGGTYWIQGEYISFLTQIKQSKTGNILASNELKIKVENLDYQGSLLPANLEQMLELQKQILEHEPSTNLMVKVTTNKGSEGLIFEEGEKMTLFITVNQPSYIRAVYFMADQNKVLLLDNQYISQADVGKLYRIPQEFECAAPFGGELLQVLAQSEPFKPLKTKFLHGYRIIEEAQEELISKSRGFKPSGNLAMKGETALTITTLPKMK
jgi:hypothetical protein